MAVYSQKLLDKCKANQLHIEDYIFCLLQQYEFNTRDAYIGAYNPTTNNPNSLSIQATKKMKDESIRRYLNILAEQKRRQDTAQIEQEKKLREQVRKELIAELEQNGTITINQVTDIDNPEQLQPQPQTIPQTQTRTKADIIRELNFKISTSTDDKEQRELYKLLIDVENMKKDIDETEEEAIHYYIPLNCSECKHYPDNKD